MPVPKYDHHAHLERCVSISKSQHARRFEPSPAEAEIRKVYPGDPLVELNKMARARAERTGETHAVAFSKVFTSPEGRVLANLERNARLAAASGMAAVGKNIGDSSDGGDRGGDDHGLAMAELDRLTDAYIAKFPGTRRNTAMAHVIQHTAEGRSAAGRERSARLQAAAQATFRIVDYRDRAASPAAIAGATRASRSAEAGRVAPALRR